MSTETQPTVPLASFEALTPTAYLDRSALVHPDKTAVVDGVQRLTYRQFRDRCLRQAGALAALGVAPGDRVAVLSPNSRLMLESHYGVLYAGGVLLALNIRLAAAELGYIIEHARPRVLLTTPELAELATAIASEVSPPARVVVDGPEYEQLLAAANPLRMPVTDECSLMALNYTSGTTGRPKGVMYHHRGAFLQALAMNTHFQLSADTVYLWTLPMFHCNGWTFTWAITAAGGTHICLPRPEPTRVWELVAAESVTHFCAAPTVLISLLNDSSAPSTSLRSIVVATGGAPPSAALLEQCAAAGLAVTHLYGLTESFGPVVICDWQRSWDALDPAERAVRRARQGVANVISQPVRLIGPDGGDVAADGATMGEIALRGNNIMLGYYLDPDASEQAMPDGWFRTGDLGVLHPDGYLELRDRAKDVIISGGENISSVEVEAALARHPAVLEAAVVPGPHEKWGERPIAWVTLRPGASATEDELRAHVRTLLASFKVPDRVLFAQLPKTASGKVRKFELRARIAAGE